MKKQDYEYSELTKRSGDRVTGSLHNTGKKINTLAAGPRTVWEDDSGQKWVKMNGKLISDPYKSLEY